MTTPNFFKLCPEWTNFFFSEEIEKILEEEEPIPLQKYKPFYLSSFESINIVLLNTTNDKNGLCFEVQKNELLTPLLEDIYNELEDEGFYPTKDGNLDHWAKQGILMLNINNYSKNLFCKIKEKLNTKNDLIWVIYDPNNNRETLPQLPVLSPQSKQIYFIENFLGSGIFKKINMLVEKFDSGMKIVF